MKNLILISISFLTLSVHSQNYNKKDDNPIVYFVGELNSEEYPLVIKTKKVDNHNIIIERNETIPVLYLYISKKEEYIGWQLIDVDNKDTTELIDIDYNIHKNNSKTKMILKGNKFKKEFNFYS